ncbi:DNA repair protein RecN [Treponema sp.]|uniref:DNA repair protein RecN n=1 Tax=Treponema sp. TaxID=166 RepID=UPI00298DFD29|nr:DNA repair protein RecN [Treponema sp.]
MLEDLSIKNFALIDSVNIEFNKGFTVLSGETGAGKSILIGALSFLLGGKASVDQIRSGQSEASVTGTFLLPPVNELDNIPLKDEDAEPKTARQWLSVHGIEAEDDRVIIRRYVRDNGKTAAWISGTPVTRADLQAFCFFLVDIHGQHEHQSLMKVTEHRKFLDSYAGITAKVAEFTELYSKLVEKRKTLSAMNTSDKEKNQKIDLLNFAVKEIEEAKLKENEDKELEAEQAKLSSFEKLFTEVETISGILSGNDGYGMVDLCKKLRSSSEKAFSLDSSLKDIDSRIENVFYEMSDLSEEVKSYARTLVFDPERLAFVQERLSLIYNLKKKYASNINAPLKEVFAYFDNAQNELYALENSSANIEALTKEVSELEKVVYKAAKELSCKRVEASSKMASSVEAILSTLGMKGTKFAVSIQEKPGTEVVQKCGPYGLDNIEFLISANPGSPLLPLAKIASGGELSRVMLALKTVFASSDGVPTMIFDEIDTGIGGEVAVSVGSHIKNLAKNRQIFCITHLASIAVYADNQIKIQKGVTNDMTSTSVKAIEGEARVCEIARMLSGDATSAESLEHARSMLEKFA